MFVELIQCFCGIAVGVEARRCFLAEWRFIRAAFPLLPDVQPERGQIETQKGMYSEKPAVSAEIDSVSSFTVFPAFSGEISMVYKGIES